MYQYLYNLAIWVYGFLMRFVAWFHPKAKLWVEGQKVMNNGQWIMNNENKLSIKKTAWFHCASLGEFEQGRPVIEVFRTKYPDYKIVLTFFSPSGYEVQKNYTGANVVLYLPLDTPKNVQKFLGMFQPEIVFFVKYEFWRNYLIELKKRSIPVILISAIFRPNQVFFKWYGGFYREVLSYFQHIFVQNESSKNLLSKIGVENVTIAGDTRFDRVWQIVEHKKAILGAEQFKGNQKLMVIGSAWQCDMDILIPLINEKPHFKFIIAPHEIKHAEIAAWQRSIKQASICFSKYKENDLNNYQVLVIDNIGMLSSLYQYADIAYVGGGFGKGLHNILEAATYGIPILFGNKSYQKFQEASDLLALSGAFSIENSADILRLLEGLDFEASGKICAEYVQTHLGATDTIIRFLERVEK